MRANDGATSDDPVWAVEGRVVGQRGERVRRLCVEEHHAGDVVGIASREHPHVWSTRGVTDDDVGPGDTGTVEQGVQVRSDGDAVLRPVASSLQPWPARS